LPTEFNDAHASLVVLLTVHGPLWCFLRVWTLDCTVILRTWCVFQISRINWTRKSSWKWAISFGDDSGTFGKDFGFLNIESRSGLNCGGHAFATEGHL
jgi:hypothetical protein